MTLAAISYGIRPGHDEEIAEVFSLKNFKRASSPIIRDDAGQVIGKIVGTGLFLREDTMVRIIQHEGELEAVARHMAVQEGVREAERKVLPYLSVSRDTRTVEGFLRYFRNSTMRCLAQRIHEDVPFTGIAARCDKLVSASDGDPAGLAAVLADAWPGVTGANGARVLATAAFTLRGTLIRVVQYEGSLEDVAEALAEAGAAHAEQALAPYLAAPELAVPRPDFAGAFERTAMRCISRLSLADVRAGM